MDFKNAQELLELCHTNNLPVSAIMKKRECILGGTTEKAIYDQMNHSLQIMRDSVTSPIQIPQKINRRSDRRGGSACEPAPDWRQFHLRTGSFQSNRLFNGCSGNKHNYGTDRCCSYRRFFRC